MHDHTSRDVKTKLEHFSSKVNRNVLMAFPAKSMLFMAVDGNVRIYDMESLCKIANLKIEGEVKSMKISPNHDLFAVQTDLAIYIFDFVPMVRKRLDL